MYSFFKISVFAFIITCSSPIFSQEKIELPVTIYIPKTDFTFFDNGTSILKDLDAMNYPFLMVDIDDIKSNIFTISFNNMGKTPTKFVYESYQKIIFNETEKYYDPNRIAILPPNKISF